MPPPTDKPALEDELGDVIEKAARNIPLSVESLAAATGIELSRLKDAKAGHAP